MRSLEICFSPLLFDTIVTKGNFTAVICDILRATTSFCTAFYHGANSIIPVASLEEIQEIRQKGFLVACGRNGEKPDFADFGNDPFEFMDERIQGKDIFYSTTNGIPLLLKADKTTEQVVIGSFLNIDKLSEFLIQENRHIVIFCSGWKGGFSFEDAFFAGALAESLLKNKKITTQCDSVFAALQLWNSGKENLETFISSRSSHLQRLIKLGKGNILNYVFQTNICPVLPFMKNGRLVMK